jgi:hypothetical protein
MPSPIFGTSYMEVNPAVALTSPKNANELASQGFQNPAFLYAWQQNAGKLPGTWEGDPDTIDAIFAIAQQYAAPPATPTLTSLAPNTVVHGGATFLLTLTGTGFTPGSSVVFGTVVEPRVTFVNATTLTCVIYSSYFPTAGTIVVKVRPGGGAADSAGVNFTVT